MAWCPKCRNEYVDGITFCNDCKTELVDSLDDVIEYKHIFISGFDNYDSLIDYLHNVGIESAHVEHSDEEDCDVIAVLPKDYADAKIHITVFVQNENPLICEDANVNEFSDDNFDSEAENTDKTAESETAPLNEADLSELSDNPESDTDDEDRENTNFMLSDKSTSYVRLSDKYEDVKSSAYTLLVVGTLGLVALLFEIAGLYKIPFNSNTKWLFYFVFGGILTACIIGGFISMMRATALKIEAEKEDALIKEILTWFSENYTSEDIDKNIELDDREELLYFNRADFIKDTIMHQFENADEPMVESLIEKIYSAYYEE